MGKIIYPPHYMWQMEIEILIQDFWKRIFLVLKNNVMSFLVVKHSKKMNVIRYSIHIRIFFQPSFRWKLFDQIEYFAHYQQNQSKLIQFSALVSTPKKSLLSSSGKLKFQSSLHLKYQSIFFLPLVRTPKKFHCPHQVIK